MDPTYPLIPVANFLAAFLTLVTFLTAQLRIPWNIGVCVLSAWVFIGTLSTGIQTIIWRDNADISLAPGLCDIATRIQLSTLAALPASTLVISRSLHRTMSHRKMMLDDRRQRRRMLVLDLFLAFGPPVFLNAVYYIVQNARFQVVEEIGCAPAWQNAGLTNLLLTSGPIILLMSPAAFYMSRTMFFLWRHNHSMNPLFGQQTAIPRALYLRVLCFGLINLLVSLIVAILNLLPLPPEFYPGWSIIHADWTPVSVTADEWRFGGRLMMFVNAWNVWINVWLAIAIFVLFGTSEDARRVYVRAFCFAVRWTNCLHPYKPPTTLLSLPSRVEQSGKTKHANLKRDVSLDTTSSAGGEQSTYAITIEIAVAIEQASAMDERPTLGNVDQEKGELNVE